MNPKTAKRPHLRIETENGPVHVWKPRHYRPRNAGVVVYVHGYFTSVDEAWDKHRLPFQFAESARNALFIVPEAPVGAHESPFWPTAEALLETVSAEGVKIPPGPLVAVGHSGAYRTIAPWLATSERLSTVVLLDGLYGQEEAFRAWIDGPASADGSTASTGPAPRRLYLVASSTWEQTERFGRSQPGAFFMGEGALTDPKLTRRERSARLVLVRSRRAHMEMVTGGDLIPLVLRRAPLPAVPEPPGSLAER